MAEVKVLITDSTGSKDTVSAKGTNSTPEQAMAQATLEGNNKQAKANKSSMKALAAASMIGSKTVSYATSNIGKWTGNQANQQAYDNAMQVVGIGTLAYINPVLAIASAGLNLGFTAIDTWYELKWDNAAKSQARAKAGYNSSNELRGWRH